MSAQVETTFDALAAAERLRDISRLAFVAVESEDFVALDSCVREGDGLIAQLGAYFAERGAKTSEQSGLLDDVRRMNALIVERLVEARERAADELGRVGAARARLRLSRSAAFDEEESAGLDRDG